MKRTFHKFVGIHREALYASHNALAIMLTELEFLDRYCRKHPSDVVSRHQRDEILTQISMYKSDNFRFVNVHLSVRFVILWMKKVICQITPQRFAFM